MLEGKVALVTGGARGIGRGCVLALAKQGATVFAADLPETESDLDSLVTGNTNCHAICADAFTPGGREGIMSIIAKEGMPVDILVCNPCSTAFYSFLDFPMRELERMLNATLVSHVHMAQLVARKMVRESQEGRIIFITSVMGSLVRTGALGYDAGKAALNHAIRGFALELAKDGITVNGVAPGFTDTPGERKFLSNKQVQALAHDLPTGRATTPEDIGNTVAFLASSLAKQITGQVITVDGGMSLCDSFFTAVKVQGS